MNERRDRKMFRSTLSGRSRAIRTVSDFESALSMALSTAWNTVKPNASDDRIYLGRQWSVFAHDIAVASTVECRK